MATEPRNIADRHQRFAELFVRNQRRMYGYLITLVGNAHDAEELFAEASLILWKKVDEFDFDAPFAPWACGIARNVFRNWRVKRGRDRHFFSDEFVERLADERQENSSWLDDARAALAGCLERLDPRHRALLQRCYSGRETFSQVAEAEGRSAEAVYQQLSRIRRRLLDCINSRLAQEEN